MTDSYLLRRVEAFLKNNPSIKPSRFGRRVLKDPGFVYDLRKGRKISEATARKVLRFLKERRRKR